MIFLGHVLSALAAVGFLPAFIISVQVMAAVVARRNPPPQTAQDDVLPSTCVLIPAHNESSGITEILASLLPQLNDKTRLLIVADNCTDDTALLARSATAAYPNVEVIERFDDELRGKGYALDYGIRFLEANPPEVVIVLDADCELSPGSLSALQHQCHALNRPIQALYLMDAPTGGGLKARVAQFAWLVKNHVRPYGDYVMGLPCLLMGSGMAFPWAQIQAAPLRTGEIVEDMKLGLELAKMGHAPHFLPTAVVKSRFPLSDLGFKTQRIRWEHGHMGVIVTDLPRIFAHALRRRNRDLFALAANLSVPPLALLTLLIGFLIIASTAHFAGGGSLVPLTLSLIDLYLLSVAVLLAWWHYGRPIISLWQLTGIPFYILAKLPMYCMFFIRRQTEWVRSKRKNE